MRLLAQIVHEMQAACRSNQNQRRQPDKNGFMWYLAPQDPTHQQSQHDINDQAGRRIAVQQTDLFTVSGIGGIDAK